MHDVAKYFNNAKVLKMFNTIFVKRYILLLKLLIGRISDWPCNSLPVIGVMLGYV